MKRLSSISLGICLLLALAAQASELRVLLNEKKVNAGTSWSDEGFQIQLAKLFAERSQRELKLVILSRKRLAKALEDGEGDILCGYIPVWLAGTFDWSSGFIDVADVLVSERRTLPPRSIADLAGLRIGTVLGYSYPEVESILGKNFIRDDGPSAASNLRKLAAKRFDYAIISEAALLHHLKSNDPPLSINPPLLIKQFKTQCAVSKKGNIGVAELNKLISEIQTDGSFAKLTGNVNRPYPSH
jgi:polar amino acid transport system substrate-binding protein